MSIIPKYSIIRNMKKEKPKLLVVDDEPDQCYAIKSYFSKRNFLVFTADEGEKALASIKENSPDLVLLDMKLAGEMTGKDVLYQLRKTDKETKVILITGNFLNEEEIEEIRGLDVADYLEKPVNLSVLEKIIKKALEKNYPDTIRFAEVKPVNGSTSLSLKRANHDLNNAIADITSKCELYVLDTEEGLYKGKSEKARLVEAIKVIKSVLKSTEKLAEIGKKISSLTRKDK